MSNYTNPRKKSLQTEEGYTLLDITDIKSNESSKTPQLPESRRKRHAGWIPVRYQVTLWLSLAMFIMYCMRVNLSVTLVAMVKEPPVSPQDSSTCPLPELSNLLDQTPLAVSGGDFDWNEATQGAIQGSVFYGYIFSHAVGGMLVQQMGGKKLMALGMLFSSAVTMATPLAAFLGPFTMVLCRAFVGLGLGVMIPGCYALMAAWIPAQERALHLSLSMAGMQLGTVTTLPLSAWLCQQPVASAWTLVFYLTGSLGFVWWLGWYWVLTDSPSSHPWISPQELGYIRQGCQLRPKTPPHPPWRQILTSRPVWAAALTSFCSSWTFYTMLTELPTYLSRILHSSMLQNGMQNALVYLVQTVVGITAGYVGDLATTHVTRFSVTTLRKMFETLSLTLTAASLFTIPSLGCDKQAVFTMVVLSQAFLGLNGASEPPLPIDMAGDLSGPVVAFVNGFGNLAGIAAPTTIGWITNNNETRYSWNIVFYLAAIVCLAGNLIFVFAGSAERQPWSRDSVDEDGEDDLSPILADSD